MTRNVVEYYTRTVRREWRRLLLDAYHQIEWLTTWRFLRRYLPPSGHILDAGGGPGRYTLELARAGYTVSLLDLTPANVEYARRHVARAHLRDRVAAISEGTVVDLSRYRTGSFDAVLCLGGVLSHVRAASDRERAVSELVRVAKRGAPIVVSVIGRMGLLISELVTFPHELTMPFYRVLRSTGNYSGARGFTACHFFLPEDFRALLERPHLRIEQMAGLEGLATGHKRALNAVARDPRRWRAWLATHYATCTHPTTVGMSEHMLAVCRKT